MPPFGEAQLAQHLFTLVLDEGVDRDAFRAALQEPGVQTSLHYPPVHRFSIYAAGRRRSCRSRTPTAPAR